MDNNDRTSSRRRLAARRFAPATRAVCRAHMTRRRFLRMAAVTAGAILLDGPLVWAKKDISLTYLASNVSGYREIAEQAQKDLGITIRMERANTIHDNMRRAITRPKSVDVVDLDFGNIDTIVRLQMLTPIETKRINEFDRLSTIFTDGSLGDTTLSTQGGAPYTHLYLRPNAPDAFAPGPTSHMALVPTMYNADTLGVRPDLVGRPITSWRELLSPEFAGRTALVSRPGVGILDAALALEAAGRITYQDKANMTRAEIDATMRHLLRLKRRGHFYGFWKDFGESVDFMASGNVVIQSMWSPAVTQVRQHGIACTYPPLAEGHRGWCYGLGLSRALNGAKLDAAYAFMNWFLSGWVGAFLGRQGYYPSVPATMHKAMQPHEWAYWMEGEPATKPIVSPHGLVIAQPGERRDGGSYIDRMSSIACWNSLMDESRYLLARWSELTTKG
ncbi:ABC transporter substrate-binding protein [Desulfobaculum sp.]